MSITLFRLSNVKNDPDWIIKEFFNTAYLQGEFVLVANAISEGRSCVINEDYCLFPEFESPDIELHFDGVKFGIMHDQVVVSNDTCRKFLHSACDRYIRLHPEDKDKIPKW